MNEPIPVYLDNVLDVIEREYPNAVDRWLRLRELVKLQKAAQHSVQRIGGMGCANCGQTKARHPNRLCDRFIPARR